LPERAAISEAARTRALKQHVWRVPQAFVATCAAGLESLLAEELGELPGLILDPPDRGRVRFRAKPEAVYALLLHARVAEGLWWVVADRLPAQTFPMLHDQWSRVRWERILPDAVNLTVRVVARTSRLRDAEGLERTLRQTIRAAGISEHPNAPALTLRAQLWHDHATVMLDIGGSLHQHFGEKWVGKTSIRDSTAAALVRSALADAGVVVDPFCGSGTLLLEALAQSRGDSMSRGQLPWMASPMWQAGRWADAKRRAAAPVQPLRTVRLFGFDIDPDSVNAAQHNLARVGAEDGVVAVASATRLDLAALTRTAPAGDGADRLLLSNPPYGKRAQGVGGAPATLLRRLLEGAHGWRFALLYPHPDDLRGLRGVRIEHDTPLLTGGLSNHLLVGRIDQG
jgi:23S rRNA G2445 N2-methylase RlmL